MEKIATQTKCQGKDVGLQTEAAPETAAIDVERERRHEVEVQILKRDLEVAEKSIENLRLVEAASNRIIDQAYDRGFLPDTRSVRMEPLRKKRGIPMIRGIDCCYVVLEISRSDK